MKKVIVLGAGMVGRTIARDLARDFAVTVADANEAALGALAGEPGITTTRRDLSSAAELGRVVEPHDLVVGALPSAMGHRVLRAVIEAHKPICDISFMGEDPLDLDPLAQARGVCAVVDCGVGPGLTSLLVGLSSTRLTETTSIEVFIGGVPEVRRWPFEYKVGFAPEDVLEEYTRPARFVRAGRPVTVPALTDAELVDVEGVGTLEAFATDGLRTLLTTMSHVPDMVEKTMRWPGHAALMRVFREAGFFGSEPVNARGTEVRPIDLSAALLFPLWRYQEGEVDLTVARVRVHGLDQGVPTRHEWVLVDRYDEASRTTSMSRTTAFPAAIMTRFMASGRFTRPGVHAPEVVGREPGLTQAMLAELEARGVRVRGTVERV
jgi:saccharopine dehydrogenase-like NADP-dependent oxidoreductase